MIPYWSHFCTLTLPRSIVGSIGVLAHSWHYLWFPSVLGLPSMCRHCQYYLWVCSPRLRFVAVACRTGYTLLGNWCHLLDQPDSLAGSAGVSNRSHTFGVLVGLGAMDFCSLMPSDRISKTGIVGVLVEPDQARLPVYPGQSLSKVSFYL